MSNVALSTFYMNLSQLLMIVTMSISTLQMRLREVLTLAQGHKAFQRGHCTSLPALSPEVSGNRILRKLLS